MVVKYLGSKSVNFTNDRGEVIKGNSLFFGYPDEGVVGIMADKCFLKETIQLPVGLKAFDDIDVTFNSKGKVISVKKA